MAKTKVFGCAAALLSAMTFASPASASCGRIGKIFSLNAQQPVTITFINRSGDQRRLDWIGYDRIPVNYAVIQNGQSYRVNTFVTHPWMIGGPDGRCKVVAMPWAGQTSFTIVD